MPINHIAHARIQYRYGLSDDKTMCVAMSNRACGVYVLESSSLKCPLPLHNQGSPMRGIIIPRACTRGKAIGLSLSSVIDTKIAISRNLGI